MGCRVAVGATVAFHVMTSQLARGAQVVELDWSSADECRMAAAVEAAVARMVKSAPVVPEPARVAISRLGPGWIATLDMRQGIRRLEGTSCEELAETMAVVIALAIEQSNNEAAPAANAPVPPVVSEPAKDVPANAAPPPRPREEVPTESEGVVVTVPPTKKEPEKMPGRAPAPSTSPIGRRGALTWGGGVGIVGEWGALPGPTGAGSIALRIAGSFWAARARGALFLSSNAVDTNGRSVGTISLGLGAIEPCVAARWLATRWELCASFEYGPMAGSGSEVLRGSKKGGTYWYALGGNLGGWFRMLDHLYVEPRLGAAFPLFHPTFKIDGTTSVHQVRDVSGRAELNLWFLY